MRVLSFGEISTVSGAVSGGWVPAGMFDSYREMAHSDGLMTAMWTGGLTVAIASGVIPALGIEVTFSVVAVTGITAVAAASFGYIWGYHSSEVW